jgi:hypothetical protein
MDEATRIARIIRKSPEDENGCWVWSGRVGSGGYGKIRVREDGREINRGAYRVLYELMIGKVPDGLVLDHLCRNRLCVNPAHLEPVTQTENVLRGEGFAAVNARKTSCPKGHPYDEANTKLYQGRRYCR